MRLCGGLRFCPAGSLGQRQSVPAHHGGSRVPDADRPRALAQAAYEEPEMPACKLETRAG